MLKISFKVKQITSHLIFEISFVQDYATRVYLLQTQMKENYKKVLYYRFHLDRYIVSSFASSISNNIKLSQPYSIYKNI